MLTEHPRTSKYVYMVCMYSWLTVAFSRHRSGENGNFSLEVTISSRSPYLLILSWPRSALCIMTQRNHLPQCDRPTAVCFHDSSHNSESPLEADSGTRLPRYSCGLPVPVPFLAGVTFLLAVVNLVVD